MNITSLPNTSYSSDNNFIQKIQTAPAVHINVLAHGIANWCQQHDELPNMRTHNQLDNLKFIIEIGLRYLTENHNQMDDTFSTICNHSFHFADRQPEGDIRQEAQRICQEKLSFTSLTGLDKLPIELVKKCLSYLYVEIPTDEFFDSPVKQEILTTYESFKKTSKRYQEYYEKFVISCLNEGTTNPLPGINTFKNLETFLIKHGSQIQKLNLSKGSLTLEQVNALIKHCPHLIDLSIPIPKTNNPQWKSIVTPSNFKNILQHENLEILNFYPNPLQTDCEHFFDQCVIGLPKLKTLYFNTTGLKALYYSQSMAHIEKIVAPYLEDFGSLISNPQLKHLDLSYTEIEDLRVLSNFKLQSLNLFEGSALDYTPLQDQTDLESLYFGGQRSGGTEIDITPIQNLKQLKEITLPIYVKDVSPLKHLGQLEILDNFCYEEPNPNLSVFEGLKNLKKLNMSIALPIDNLSFLSHLIEIETLDLEIDVYSDSTSQQLLNVSALSHFKKLKKLRLSAADKALDFDEREVLRAINGLVDLEYLCLHNTIYPTKESIKELRNTLLPSNQQEHECNERKQSNKRLFSELQDLGKDDENQNLDKDDENQEPQLKKNCIENDKN